MQLQDAEERFALELRQLEARVSADRRELDRRNEKIRMLQVCAPLPFFCCLPGSLKGPPSLLTPHHICGLNMEFSLTFFFRPRLLQPAAGVVLLPAAPAFSQLGPQGGAA